MTMEMIRIVRSSGFFLSSAVTIGIGIMLLEIIATPIASLFWTLILVPIFFGSLVLRSRLWLSAYRRSIDRNLVYLVTALALIPLGIVIFVLFTVYASMQTVLLSLSEYAGVSYLIVIAAVWSIYSLMELLCVYKLFGKSFLPIGLLIASIALIDLSIVFALRLYVYLLPSAMFLLSLTTAVIGAELVLGKEKINLG